MSENRKKPLILLATDSTRRSKLVAGQLQQHFQVKSAADAEAAWEAIVEPGEISLLIGDLALMLNPFGLLERLRNAGDSRLAATPVLLLVGESDSDSERERAFQTGATDFINLPFSSAELSARARLHANLYLQHARMPTEELAPIAAANLLQQLSQKNYFYSRLEQEISFSLRHRSSFSLCKLKLDNIKSIVAGFDKATAITVVNRVAALIQETLRREDTLCYLGNAEFQILYPATNGIGATTGARRILERIGERKVSIAGKRVPVTLSAAVYGCVAAESTDSEQIVERLEQGLEQATTRGGNQVVCVSTGGDQRGPSLDQALALIEAGKSDELTAHAAPLLRGVLPLLELADSALQLGLESLPGELRRHLDFAEKTGTEQ